MPRRPVVLAAALFLAVAPAFAADVAATGAWIRTPVPGAPAAAAYLTLTSAHGGRLVAASTPVAANADLHEMKMDGDVMRMRALDALALPAGQAVSLAPNGNHLMLTGLKPGALKDGARVPLTLTVEDAKHRRTKLTVEAVVAATAPAPAASR